MRFDSERLRRRSLRSKVWDDRTPAWYFITLNVEHGVCLFGDVVAGEMHHNEAGAMVVEVWASLPGQLPFVELGDSVVMPNHLHGLLHIVPPEHDSVQPDVRLARTMHPRDVPPGPRLPGTTDRSLGRAIQAFKTLSTARYAARVHAGDWPPFDGRLWQRNYDEHVVRDEDDLTRIRTYIAANPSRWRDDDQHPRLHPDNPIPRQ